MAVKTECEIKVTTSKVSKFQAKEISAIHHWYFLSEVLAISITINNTQKTKTQLSLTNRATRLEILTFEKYRDLEIGVRGQ